MALLPVPPPLPRVTVSGETVENPEVQYGPPKSGYPLRVGQAEGQELGEVETKEDVGRRGIWDFLNPPGKGRELPTVDLG